MIVTAPILATPLPPAPDTNDPDNFDDLADARIAAEGPFGDQLNSLALNVFANATEAYTRALAAQQSAADAASAASAAAASTTAVKWVAGTYGDGDVAWSPTSRFSYRHIGNSASTIDPAIDPGSWVLQLFALGLGGMIITGSVDLATTSGGAISVTPSGPGLYITLPDATTITAGAIAFHVCNAGVYDMGVKNKAGTVLGWIRPGASSVIGLASAATLAGRWVATNLQKLGVTAQLNVASVQGATLKRIAIDANRTMFLFGAVYAVVYDSSTLQWGAPLLIRSISNGAMAGGILVAANKVLVTSCDTTSMQSVVLSLTGTSIGLSTPISHTAGNSVTQWGEFIAIGSGFALSYVGVGTETNGSYVRFFTVSGTTPTAGPEVAFSGYSVLPILFVSGGTLRAVGYDSLVRCQPYTLSGATLVPGTGVQLPLGGTGGVFRAFQNGNGNIVVVTASATLYVGVFKLTGTVEAMTYTPALTSAPVNLSEVDIVVISGTKTAIARANGGNGYLEWNIHFDSSGTSTVGTSDQLALNHAEVAAIGATGNSARFLVSNSANEFSPFQLQFDCSGSSPVRGNVQARKGVGIPAKYLSGKAPRHFSVLSAGDNQYALGAGGTPVPYDGVFNATGIQSMPTLGESWRDGALGATASESWLLSGISSGFSIGTTIKRIEAAA